MGASLCKVNCCNIRLQRALPLIEMDCLPEFCPILPEFLLLSTTFNTTLIILQPSGGTLPFGPLKNRSVELMSNTLISNGAGLLVGLAIFTRGQEGKKVWFGSWDRTRTRSFNRWSRTTSCACATRRPRGKFTIIIRVSHGWFLRSCCRPYTVVGG